MFSQAGVNRGNHCRNRFGFSTELGIEWRFDRGTDFVSGLQSGATLGAGGINFSYAILDEAKRWMATVSALAQKGKSIFYLLLLFWLRIAKRQKLIFTQEVPVATSIYNYTNVNDNLLETSIQYRNTGVILSVTPHINEYGLVSMDVNQEVSEQAGLVNVSNIEEQRPSFFKRSVNTTLTVKNGQTIVIGGLDS
jgi:general secretion pathway protein D